jgi:hypothetical protein
MKTYEGVDVYRRIFSWPRRWLEVSDQLYTPTALPPEKELSTE